MSLSSFFLFLNCFSSFFRGDKWDFANFAVNPTEELSSFRWHEPQHSRRGPEADQQQGVLLQEAVHHLHLQSRRDRAWARAFRGARKQDSSDSKQTKFILGTKCADGLWRRDAAKFEHHATRFKLAHGSQLCLWKGEASFESRTAKASHSRHAVALLFVTFILIFLNFIVDQFIFIVKFVTQRVTIRRTLDLIPFISAGQPDAPSKQKTCPNLQQCQSGPSGFESRSGKSLGGIWS